MAVIPDQLELRRAYARNAVLAAMFDHAAARQRNATEWTVENAEKAIAGAGTFLRSEVIDAFRAMEELGLGEFIVGRRGMASRFSWRVPMIDAGKVAKGLSNELPLLDDTGEEGELLLINPRGDADTINHTYNLRPDFVVGLRLPRNFSDHEALRLADFVKTLPFSVKSG